MSSPALDEPTRTKEEVALDVAKRCLETIAMSNGEGAGLASKLEVAMTKAAQTALARIDQILTA